MELLLIRHAQSQNNALPESQRVEDPGITETGRRQAALLAERLPQWDVELVLTSAFRRALETAAALQAVGVQPHIWSELHEVGGCYEGHLPGQMNGRPGMSAETIEKHFPGFTMEQRISEEGWWACRARETNSQSWQRAESQAGRLVQLRQQQRRVACVIHADFKSLLLQVLLGDAWQPLAAEPLYNTGVTWLDCGGDQIQVLKFNDVAHLPEDCLTD